MHQDPFYNDTGDIDSIRFPLLKPYEAIKVDNSEFGWYVHFAENDTPYFQLSRIEKIAIEGDVMMFYAPKLRQFTEQPIWRWIVIVPKDKIEIGFGEEADFLGFIKTYGIDEPIWTTGSEIYNEFIETGCLSWIPDCATSD